MYPPNLPSIPPPPQQPLSGRPATPRMLRSISGTLKSKTELAHSDKGQESNNETKNSNSLTMYLIHIPDNHHQNHSNQIFKLQQLFMESAKGLLLPPPSIPNPNTMKPAPTPTGVDQPPAKQNHCQHLNNHNHSNSSNNNSSSNFIENLLVIGIS